MKIIREGFSQAMKNDEIYVNTRTDEIVRFVVNDPELRKEMYCKKLKITIEAME